MRTSWICLFSLLAASVVAGEPELPGPSSGEACNAMFKSNGKETIQKLESFRVMEADPSSPFVLPKDAPQHVSAIVCARKSLVPGKYDYRVLVAGFPLAIVVPDERKAALELSSKNLILYRMIEGKLSDEEALKIQESLKANQLLLNKYVGK